MSLLKWHSDYSVGVASMDDEHREMIDLINDIYAQLEAGSDAEKIEQCLGEIFSVISSHFALEERLMQKCNYSEYQAHKDDHEDLLDRIRDLMDDFATSPSNGAQQLRQHLSDWFAGHFSSFDARLHGRLRDG